MQVLVRLSNTVGTSGDRMIKINADNVKSNW